MAKGSRAQPGQLALFAEAVLPEALPATTSGNDDRMSPDPSPLKADGDAALDPTPFVARAKRARRASAAPAIVDSGQPDVAATPQEMQKAVPVTLSPLPTAPRSRGGDGDAGSGRARLSRTGAAMAAAREPGPTVTLDEALPQYLGALAAAGRSHHTMKSFELDLRLLRGQVGNRAVGTITTAHLRQFIAWVRLSRDNAPNSLRRKVATLKNFFGYLRDEGYLAASPADTVPYPEAYVALPEFLEDEAAERLLATAESNPFWYAIVLLMLETGLKRDEVLALRVADLYLASAGESYLVVRETDAAKRLRSRKLAVSGRLRAALHDYYGVMPREGGDSRVFDISVRGINFIVETCGERAEIVTSKPRLTPQVLRETFAVHKMRAFVEEERLHVEQGATEEALQLLTLRHDAELLEALGLKEDPDSARKYRQLVHV